MMRHKRPTLFESLVILMILAPFAAIVIPAAIAYNNERAERLRVASFASEIDNATVTLVGTVVDVGTQRFDPAEPEIQVIKWKTDGSDAEEILFNRAEDLIGKDLEQTLKIAALMVPGQRFMILVYGNPNPYRNVLMAFREHTEVEK